MHIHICMKLISKKIVARFMKTLSMQLFVSVRP